MLELTLNVTWSLVRNLWIKGAEVDEPDKLIEVFDEVVISLADDAFLGKLSVPCFGKYLHFLKTKVHGLSDDKYISPGFALALLLDKEQVIVGVEEISAKT